MKVIIIYIQKYTCYKYEDYKTDIINNLFLLDFCIISLLQLTGFWIVSTDYLVHYMCNPTEFLCQFITTDETWVHDNTQETK